METIKRSINGTVVKQMPAAKTEQKNCQCKECSYPNCQDPVWNESYCQYHYNEEHYLAR